MTENPIHPLYTNAESSERPSKVAKTAEDISDVDEEQEQQQPMSQNPRLQRYLVAIEYIGTRFSGSQQQPNFRTVVGVIQVISLAY